MSLNSLFGNIYSGSGIMRIEYLGHFISTEGVATDPKMIQIITDWPASRSIKQLRSFLGLARYYRRVVRGYRILAKPLTNLLRKGKFRISQGLITLWGQGCSEGSNVKD